MHVFFFFRGTFFQCDINLLINYNKIIKRRLFFLRHLLGQPARADGRDPAKITGRFRANFRLAMCTFNSKLICSAGVQTFFSQGGAPRQRSEIPHRMIPIPHFESGGQQPEVRLFSPHQSTFHQYHVTSFSDLYSVYWKKSPLRGLDNVPAELSPCVFLFPQPELTAPQSILQLLM